MRVAVAAITVVLMSAGFSAAGPILISELYYDAPGADGGATFIELFGPAGSDLSGFVIEGVNGSGGGVTNSLSLDGLRIPADRILVLADRLAGGGTEVFEADYILPDLDFQNGPDSVRLLAGSLVVDALGYGTFSAGSVFAGEGGPAPDAMAGSSLARWFADKDTDDNFRDFRILDVPTPGTAPVLPPSAAVPEPGAFSAMALGLGGMLLFAAARRRVSRGRCRSRRALRSS